MLLPYQHQRIVEESARTIGSTWAPGPQPVEHGWIPGPFALAAAELLSLGTAELAEAGVGPTLGWPRCRTGC